MTNIYCDIADITSIKKYDKRKIVKGFTTNPSLMRKAGATDYEVYSKKILSITKKPVSLEVFADDEKNMIIQGTKINSWSTISISFKAVLTSFKTKSSSKETSSAAAVSI